MIKQNSDVNLPLLIQSIIELRTRLNLLIARMNYLTSLDDAPTLSADTEQWVQDLMPTRLMLEMVEGFAVPTVDLQIDKVAYSTNGMRSCRKLPPH